MGSGFGTKEGSPNQLSCQAAKKGGNEREGKGGGEAEWNIVVQSERMYGKCYSFILRISFGIQNFTRFALLM